MATTTVGIIAYIGQQVFFYGIGFYAIVCSIKKLKEKKTKK